MKLNLSFISKRICSVRYASFEIDGDMISIIESNIDELDSIMSVNLNHLKRYSDAVGSKKLNECIKWMEGIQKESHKFKEFLSKIRPDLKVIEKDIEDFVSEKDPDLEIDDSHPTIKKYAKIYEKYEDFMDEIDSDGPECGDRVFPKIEDSSLIDNAKEAFDSFDNFSITSYLPSVEELIENTNNKLKPEETEESEELDES